MEEMPSDRSGASTDETTVAPPVVRKRVPLRPLVRETGSERLEAERLAREAESANARTRDEPDHRFPSTARNDPPTREERVAALRARIRSKSSARTGETMRNAKASESALGSKGMKKVLRSVAARGVEGALKDFGIEDASLCAEVEKIANGSNPMEAYGNAFGAGDARKPRSKSRRARRRPKAPAGEETSENQA